MATQVASHRRQRRRLIATGVRGEIRTAPGIVGEPSPCPSCMGEGTLRFRTCYHSGVCPCTPDEISCEVCRGTGAVQCAHCGEDDGTVQTPDGLYCRGCAGEVGDA